MIMLSPDHPAVQQIERQSRQEKAALAEQPKIIEILQKKLEEAQNAVLREMLNSITK